MRWIMAAFLPWVAATLILEALHSHALAPDHGPLCPHHLNDSPPPTRAASGFECPACNWQRNQARQSATLFSPHLVGPAAPVFAPATVVRRARADAQPALFRGPPALS
jgi:hypothetical protein